MSFEIYVVCDHKTCKAKEPSQANSIPANWIWLKFIETKLSVDGNVSKDPADKMFCSWRCVNKFAEAQQANVVKDKTK